MSIPNEPAPDKAARLGLDLVRPADNELFVDLDSEYALREFWPRLEALRQVFSPVSVKWTRSQGGKWHAYISIGEAGVQKFDRLERVALQAALGSDPLREMIAVTHLKLGYEYENVFFETPGVVMTCDPHQPPPICV